MFCLPKKFPLLPRKPHTDKSHYGHTFVLAGSSRMSGAAVLTATAALRSGSGLVTWGMPSGVSSPKLPLEIMRKELPSKNSSFSAKAGKEALAFIQKRRVNSVALGPGLGLNSGAQAFVRKVVAESPVPVVLDADGLNSFKGAARLLKKRRSPLILTPHEGEFQRLFGQKVPGILARRAALAKMISKFYDVVLVLKGHRTLVVCRDVIYVNNTGNAGMAKGGSGDVLTGLIASFVAQGLDVFKAAVWAVYVHGKAGDTAVRKTGELSLTASDMIDSLPKVFISLR